MYGTVYNYISAAMGNMKKRTISLMLLEHCTTYESHCSPEVVKCTGNITYLHTDYCFIIHCLLSFVSLKLAVFLAASCPVFVPQAWKKKLEAAKQKGDPTEIKRSDYSIY